MSRLKEMLYKDQRINGALMLLIGLSVMVRAIGGPDLWEGTDMTWLTRGLDVLLTTGLIVTTYRFGYACSALDYTS